MKPGSYWLILNMKKIYFLVLIMGITLGLFAKKTVHMSS